MNSLLASKYTKPIVFMLCLMPLGVLFYWYLVDSLGANPIETVNRRTGDWALRFLLITLAITPIRRLTRWNSLVNYRRMLGLFTFFYVCVHLTSYTVLDQFFNFSEIFADILKRPFITAGFSAFILLIPLAITSNDKMVEKLQHHWVKLHKLVYIVAMLAVLHFWWMVKIDTREPMIYAVILFFLLAFRLFFYFKRKIS